MVSSPHFGLPLGWPRRVQGSSPGDVVGRGIGRESGRVDESGGPAYVCAERR